LSKITGIIQGVNP